MIFAGLMRNAWSVVILLLAVIASGCDRSSDASRREEPPKDNGGREDHPVVNPGGENRPGPSDVEIDFVSEFKDDVARYSGHGVAMRFDQGGILVKTFADGRSEFIDLDGDKRVSFMPGAMGSDSICRDAVLAVDDKAVEVQAVCMKKKSSAATWYLVIDCDNRSHLLVLPVM